MTTTLSPHLIKLFEDIDFIASARVNCKPCFRDRTYVSKNSYYGSFKRCITGEDGNKCMHTIRDLCGKTVEELIKYKDTFLYTIIIGKIISLRRGILIIKDTYSDNIDISSSLNQSILILNLSIPEDTRKENDIII